MKLNVTSVKHLISPLKVFLSTGTDEHGMKIQRAAERDGVAPR